MLSRFNVIVAVDEKNGIGKVTTDDEGKVKGNTPWKNQDDMKHFSKTTIGNGNNCSIMGRCTYESIPAKFRPLPKRKNFVISSIDIPGVDTFRSLGEALKAAVGYDEVYVIGGEQLYTEAVQKYNYLCDELLISHIPGVYDCNRFFPYNDIKGVIAREINNMDSFKLETITTDVKHPEEQYLNIFRKILSEGDKRMDRTGTGTLAIFSPEMVFDLRDGFPLFTTKRTWFNGILKELLFFISGQTNSKILEEIGVDIWKKNTSEEYLKKYGLPWKEGDMGPEYGFQWRHSGAKYTGCDNDYHGEGIDQLQNVINGIKEDPFGRRHIISSWNVVDIPLMVLPPCHCFAQFFVGTDKEGKPAYLDCCLYQRSGDMFLGVPFNTTSYVILMESIGKLTKLTPRKLIHKLGDAHIYLNHIDQVKEQLKRTPYPFPRIKFNRDFENIDDLKFNDVVLKNYIHHPEIRAEMAV